MNTNAASRHGSNVLPDPALVREAAARLSFFPDDKACQDFATYLGLLVKWNKAMNLVGPGNWQQIFDSLVVDSFYLASFVAALALPKEPRCLDLGAGAGLPGLPLRILWKQGSYTLVEAREKRALFLRTVLAACALPGVEVYQGRAEQVLGLRGGGDMIVSRAFMPWEQVLSLVQDFCAPGAFCLFLANTPMPDTVPEQWEALQQRAYAVQEKERYLWALQKK